MKRVQYIRFNKQHIKGLRYTLCSILIVLIYIIAVPSVARADTITQSVMIIVPPGMEHLGRIPQPSQGGGSALVIGIGKAAPGVVVEPTYPTAQLIMRALKPLPPAMLTDIPIVAKSFGVDSSTLALKYQEIAPVVREQIMASGLELRGALKSPLEVVLSAVSLRNPELSTVRGMAGFVRDVMTVSSNGVIAQAMDNSHKAEIFTKMVTSMTLGTPLDRRTFDQDFSALGAVLYEREKQVVQSGEFQKFFNRNPKKTEEWKVVKVVAYRGRSLPQEVGGGRSLARETSVRKRYERVFKVDLTTLAKSTNPADQGRVAQAWSMIRAVAASELRIQ